MTRQHRGELTLKRGGSMVDNGPLTTSCRFFYSNIKIEGNSIENIKCWSKEIPSAINGAGTPQTDARGAVFQFWDTFSGAGIAMDSAGKYVSNPVADMQLCKFLSRASLKELEVVRFLTDESFFRF